MADSFFVQAEKKLAAELKSGKFDRYGTVMKQAVHDALLDFCRQDGEFAQAVAQGGSFGDCMAAVAKCVKGNGISDMEAYGAAVRYYFPGAVLRVTMAIDLIGEAGDGGGGSAESRERVSPEASHARTVQSTTTPRGTLPDLTGEDASDSADGGGALMIDLSDFF